MATQFLNCFLWKISKPTFFGHNGQCQCVKSQRKIKRFHLIIHVSNAPALLSTLCMIWWITKYQTTIILVLDKANWSLIFDKQSKHLTSKSNSIASLDWSVSSRAQWALWAVSSGLHSVRVRVVTLVTTGNQAAMSDSPATATPPHNGPRQCTAAAILPPLGALNWRRKLTYLGAPGDFQKWSMFRVPIHNRPGIWEGSTL